VFKPKPNNGRPSGDIEMGALLNEKRRIRPYYDPSRDRI
jgi:hypothetical protein